MAGLLDTGRKRIADRKSLQEKLVDARKRRGEIQARRQSSREARFANADGSIDEALAWLDGQLLRYGAGERVLSADALPGQLPMVATWIAVAGGPLELRERWRAVLAARAELNDEPLAKVDAELAKVEAEVSRLESELAAIDAEREELRAAVS